jgi:nucleoside-diphosphate-sugar epimerase
VLAGENLSWKQVFGTLAEAMHVAPPRREVGPALLTAFAVASEVVGFVSRSRPLLTRETARMTSATTCYDNRRARESLGWTHRPFQATAERIAAHLEAEG